MRAALLTAIFAAAALGAGPARATEAVPASAADGEAKPAPGAGPGYWLWRDAAGWHLRWTGGPAAVPEKKAIFTGIVTAAGGRLSNIKPAGMVGGDDSCIRLDGGRAVFKSEAAGTVEGIDFKAGEDALALHLELFIDYAVIAPASVHLGAAGRSPTETTPFLHIDLAQAPAAPPPGPGAP